MLVPSLAVTNGMVVLPAMAGGAILTTRAHHSSAGVSTTGWVCRANVGRIMHRSAAAACGERRPGKKCDHPGCCAAFTGGRGIPLFHAAHAARVSRAAERIPARHRDLFHAEESGAGDSRTDRQLPAVDGRAGIPGVLLRTGARPLEPFRPARSRAVHDLWNRHGGRVPVDDDLDALLPRTPRQ